MCFLDFAVLGKRVIAKKRKLWYKKYPDEQIVDLSSFRLGKEIFVDLMFLYKKIPDDQLMDLSSTKLMEQIAATKAVAMQKQLEKEVLDLEEERSKLKMKLRSGRFFWKICRFN